jgi:hypothetical protein
VPEQVQEDTDLGRKFTDEGTEPTLLVSDAVSGVLLFQTVEAHKDYPVIREPSTEAKSVQTSLNTGHLQISSEEPSKSAVPMSQDPHQNPVEPILSSEPLEDQMVRILTAKERQALFWESLDCDIGPSTSPRVHHPQKLRKRRSDPSRRIFSNMILSAMRRPVNFGKKARKVTPVPDTPTQSLYPLDLLNGIEKIGNGIGFTYSQPLAARSKASICTTTPRSCYGIFSNRFSAPIFRPIKRKVKSCLDQGSGGMETNEEREQMAVTREVHESVWNLGASPVFLSSPTERTVVNSPASDAGLLTPSTVLFKDANTKEIKAGDLDATLRLVSPPSFSPMSGCRPVDFHRFERPFEAC